MPSYPTTVIDVIERSLGTSLTKKLTTRRRGIDAETKRRIALDYLEWEDSTQGFTCPEIPKNEVCPYVHPEWVASEDLGRNLVSKSIETTIAGIKSLLIYYHRIALPDWFGYVCDIYKLCGEDINEATDAKFSAYLKLFAEIRPLIANGTVILMPEHLTWAPARNAVSKLNRPDWFDSLFHSDVFQFARLREIIEQSFWISRKYDLDLLVPTAGAAKFLDEYVRATGRDLTQMAQQEARLASVLLACDLPRLDELTLADMMSIRQQSRGFAGWRNQLRSILKSFYSDCDSGTLDQTEFLRYANEELAQRRNEIENELRNSNYLTSLSSGLKVVGIGTLTGLVTSPVAVGTALTAGIVAGGSTFLVEYFLSKARQGEHKQLKALRAHFALFDVDESAK